MATSPVTRSAPEKTPPASPADKKKTPPPPPPPAPRANAPAPVHTLTTPLTTSKTNGPSPVASNPSAPTPTPALTSNLTTSKTTGPSPVVSKPPAATPATDSVPPDAPKPPATPAVATNATDPKVITLKTKTSPGAPAADPTAPPETVLKLDSSNLNNTVSLASTTTPEDSTDSGLPPGVDLTKTPQQVKDITARVKDIVQKNGADILQQGITNLNIDRSFEDPKTIGTLDLSKLTENQRAAYYIDLKQASNLNTFLDNQYGDNLYGKNLTTGAYASQPGVAGSVAYPGTVVGNDINARLKTLEDLGVSQSLGNIMNGNIGNWIKANDQTTYQDIQTTFDETLFSPTAANIHNKLTIGDSLTSLNTTALLGQTYLAADDFKNKSGDLSTTYNSVMTTALQSSTETVGDFSLRDRGGNGSKAPPVGSSKYEYDRWYHSLTDNSASKLIQPIVQESFDASDTAKQLAAAGVTKDSDVWNQYKDTFVKDTTSAYNNYWGTIRRGVKMDTAFIEAKLPNGELVVKSFNNLPKVAGVDVDAYRAGAFHTVQNVTLSAALAGSILAGQNGSDPKSAMTLTYAATNMADVLGETAAKYLDPKNGAFTKLGLNKNGSWTSAVGKYLPGGDFQTIGGVTKMLAGAGQVIGGAAGIWNAVDAAKNGDAPAAVLNSVGAVSNVISGLATGAEGVLQYTNIVRNMVTGLFPGAGGITGTVLESAAKSALASVGWAAGLVGGLALTGLGIYDMAKGVKVLDKSLKQANEKLIAPTTGWNYEFLFGPKL
jgi:hypothetical protein